MQKISSKVVNPRDIAGNAEEEEEESWKIHPSSEDVYRLVRPQGFTTFYYIL